MAMFDFISHDELRASLESDYRELSTTMEGRAYKSVHVLAGSIIEALLVEHLIFIDYKNKTGRDPLNMSLEKLIESSKEEGIITQRVVDLSTVIRSYRNLIHPGRLIRLREKVDSNGARIAQTLVEMILEEISERRRSIYGYTSNQIIEKMKKDLSFKVILDDILKSTNPVEIERLLTTIPRIDVSAMDAETYYLERLEDMFEYCFHASFEMASDAVKEKICEHYALLIREGGANEILRYGNSFFRSKYLKHLSATSRDLVKKHLIHRMADLVGHDYNPMILNGLGSYISPSESSDFIDPIIRALNFRNTTTNARSFLIQEYNNFDSETKQSIIGRLDDWSVHYSERGSPELCDKIMELKQHLTLTDEDLPF